MTDKNIILLHGALGAAADLKKLAEALQAEGLRPHILEFSGHGTRSFATEFGIIQFSHELRKYIADNGLQDSAVFGYSMGGYVALHASSLDSELKGPVVTLGTKLNWTPEIIRQESGFCNLEFLQQKAPAFAQSLAAKHKDHEQLLHRTAAMIQAFESGTLIGEEWQPPQKIFLGVGDRDKLVTVEECRNFAKTRKSCGVFMLPHTGHPFDQADPLLLAKMIKRLLETA